MGSKAGASERGAAVAETILVSLVLIFLLLAVMQVAIYLHIRNIVTASAAEGARYSAAADRTPADGAIRAHRLLSAGAGSGTAAHIRCTGTAQSGELATTEVTCSGAIPVFFLPFADVIPLDVTAHAVREGD